jgi:hypothetical protein
MFVANHKHRNFFLLASKQGGTSSVRIAELCEVEANDCMKSLHCLYTYANIAAFKLHVRIFVLGRYGVPQVVCYLS